MKVEEAQDVKDAETKQVKAFNKSLGAGITKVEADGENKQMKAYNKAKADIKTDLEEAFNEKLMAKIDGVHFNEVLDKEIIKA